MNIIFTSIQNLWRRLRGYRAALRLLLDPSRLDAVFEIDDAFPDRDAVFARLVHEMRVHPEPAEALARRMRLAIDLPALRSMPDGTFGRAVGRFFDDNGLDPRSIPTLDDAGGEGAWAHAHLYETHDVWHVAIGFATDEAGELGLQAFYAAQLPGHLPQLLVAGGLLQAAFWHQDDFRRRLDAIARGWEAGTHAKPLFGVRWDAMWDLPVERVRAELGLGQAA